MAAPQMDLPRCGGGPAKNEDSGLGGSSCLIWDFLWAPRRGPYLL